MVKFWRSKSKAEVDFVVETTEKPIPVEVKSTLREPKVPLSLRNFIELYQPQKALVVNLSLLAETRIKKTRIFFWPIWGLYHPSFALTP